MAIHIYMYAMAMGDTTKVPDALETFEFYVIY